MRRGIAVDTKTNRWIETQGFTDDDLDAVLYHGPTGWFEPLTIFAVVIALAFLASGCTQRSQSGDEQIAVARKCEARGMNVVSSEGGFPWGGLEYAECVKPPQGVTPAEFIGGR